MKSIDYNGTDIEYHRNTTISISGNNVKIKSDNKEYNFKHKSNDERTKCVKKFRTDYERILDGN